MLSIKQLRQEKSYVRPYHWLMQDKLSQEGRLYFGYIDYCVTQVNNYSGRILDAGCGDGRLLGEIYSVSKIKKELYGVDYSTNAIEFARLFVPEATFIQADLIKLPYEDNFFDVIFLVEVLEHFRPDDIPKILRELSRIIKKDGRLIITVPSILMGLPGVQSKHYQHFTPKTLSDTLNGYFVISNLSGQYKTGWSFLKVLYRLIDNKLFDIKILRKWYNKNIWPRYFNICKPKDGMRLISVCSPCK